MTSTVSTIILGAGASIRMASPKQLAPYKGKALLEHAICTAQEADCGPIVVVLGAHADLIARSLQITCGSYGADLGPVDIFNCGRNKIHFLHNSRWNEGQSSSLVLGVWAALLTNSQSVLIMLCDQPWIDAVDLRRLIDAQTRSSVGIAAAAFAQTIGAPACFSRARFGELLQLQGDRGAKMLLTKYTDQIERVAMPHAEMDIDTPADLCRLQDWWPVENRGLQPTSPRRN